MERYKRVFPAFRELEIAKDKKRETLQGRMGIICWIIGLAVILASVGSLSSGDYSVLLLAAWSAIWGTCRFVIKEWVED